MCLTRTQSMFSKEYQEWLWMKATWDGVPHDNGRLANSKFKDVSKTCHNQLSYHGMFEKHSLGVWKCREIISAPNQSRQPTCFPEFGRRYRSARLAATCQQVAHLPEGGKGSIECAANRKDGRLFNKFLNWLIVYDAQVRGRVWSSASRIVDGAGYFCPWSPIWLKQIHQLHWNCFSRTDSATVSVYIWQGAVETFAGSLTNASTEVSSIWTSVVLDVRGGGVT